MINLVEDKAAVRILVSARDAGAAHQNFAFVEACLKSGRDFAFEILLQPPATDVFSGLSAPVRSVDSTQGSVALVESTFQQFKPQFALVGLSGFGQGIDEAVLAYAKREGIPSGAIQDYWGYLGSIDASICPDVFFVLDEAAKQLTAQRAAEGTRIEVTGSPRHEAYRARVDTWIRRETPESLGHSRVVFILQPRTVPGLLDNVAVFLGALDKVELPISAALKLHPADADRGVYIQMFTETTTAVDLIPANVPIETVLAEADLVATCFSSAGLDHNYMQLYSPNAIGALLYLAIGTQIQAFMREVIGLKTVPGAVVGMGKSFDCDVGLSDWIRRALSDEEERQRYRRAVHDNLAVSGSPSRSIADYIQSQHGKHYC